LCSVCALGARVDSCFTFFAGFKRVSPWLFRGPLWLSPTELETQVLDSKIEIDSLKASPVVSDEVDCADCSIFLADLALFKEKHVSKCEELDVLWVEVAELKSRSALLGACTSCPILHAKIDEMHV
jgi:hypothetical protein